MASRMGVAVMAVLVALAASVRAQSTPNAQINLDMEVYGSTIQPFNSTKASTIGQGIANLLADGTQASQISIQDQGALAASASGGTGLGNGQPGVNLGVTIQTLQSRAQQEIDTIYNSLFNGKLQTQWGQLSLQITGVNVTRNSTSGLTGEAVPFVPATAPQQGAPTPAPPPAATAPAPAPLQTQFPPAPGPSPVQLTANLILADANLSLPLSQADEQNIIQSVLQVLPPGYTAADLSLGSAQSLAQAASAPAFSTSSQAGRRLLQSGSGTQVQVLINSASGDAQQAQNAIQTAVNSGQLSQALQANGVPVSGVTTTSSIQTPTQDLQTSGVNISQGNIGNPTPTPAPASPSPTPASPSPSPAAATSPSPAAATSPSPASASPPSSSRALSSSGGGGGFPTWAVAPIVVGALICLALVGVLLFCCVWRPRKQRKKQEADYVQKYFENVNKGEPYPNNAAPAAAAGGAGAGGLAGLQQQLRSDSMSSTNSMTRNPMLLPVGPGGLTRTNSGLLRTPSGQLLRTNSGSFANPVAGGGGGGPGSVVSDRSGVSRTPSGQLRSASWQQPPLQRTNSGTSGNGVVRSTSGTGAGAATGAGAGASMNRANSFGAVPRSVSASDGSAGGLIGPRDAANPLAQGNGSVLPVRQRSTSPGQRRPGRMQDTNALTGLTTKPNWVRGKVGKPNLDVLDTQ
eukprot:jgi/Astpho2/9548/Aster-03830